MLDEVGIENCTPSGVVGTILQGSRCHSEMKSQFDNAWSCATWGNIPFTCYSLLSIKKDAFCGYAEDLVPPK